MKEVKCISLKCSSFKMKQRIAMAACIIGWVSSVHSAVLLNDTFDGSISPDWTITGTEPNSTATADGAESAFSAGSGSLRLDDKSDVTEVNLRYTMPTGQSITDGESLTIEFDWYSVDAVLPLLAIQDGTANAGRLSLRGSFNHREGAGWATLDSTANGTWYRVSYTYYNDAIDTVDISLTPFGGVTTTWSNRTVEVSKASVNSILFSFNVGDTTLGKEWMIDNVTITETRGGALSFFDNLKANRVESNPLVQWQHFGPGLSGYIDMFWINNGDPNAMYDSFDMGNYNVTLNGGEFWKSMRDSDGTGYHTDLLVAMDFSYTDPDFGLAVRRNVKDNRSEVLQTTDRGVSWKFLTQPIPGSNERHNVIAVDPGNDNFWYIGAGGGAFISRIHYTKSGIVYTSPWNSYMSEGFILYSKNRGATWTQVSSPFPSDSSFSRIIVDPRNSNNVYASCQYGVYKSTNGGVSWAKVPGNGLPYNQPRFMDFYYDADANGGAGEFLLYIVEITHYDTSGSNIITSGGVYRSADGGTNWDNLTGDLAIDMTQVSLWGYRSRFWRAVSWWLEMDQSLAEANYNLPTSTFSQFHQISVDPTNKDRIYLVHNFKHDYSFPPGNIWMTETGGTNWFAAAREGPYWINGVDSAYWQSRAVQPTGMNTRMAHVDREHRQLDNVYVGPRFVKCNQLGEVYTAFAQQILRSTDHGASWRQVDDDETEPGNGHWVGRGNSNLPGESFCLNTGTPGTYLWGSGEHGVWRNTHDGDLVYPGAIAVEQLTGQSIQEYDSLSISTIAVDPNNTNKIYTLQFRQSKRNDLRYSSDGGASWTTLSEPFPEIDIRSESLLIDHENSDNMYFTIPYSIWKPYGGGGAFRVNRSDDSSVYGIYKSTNGGVNWNKAENGIPAGSSVWQLFMDPVDSQTIYAALPETHDGVIGGLYKTTNGGANWSAMPIPSGVRSVNDVMVHKTSGNMYIACGKREGEGTTGGAYISRDGGANWILIFDLPYVRGVDACAVNEDVIAVIAGEDDDIGDLNPGAYVTIDGAVTWHKINRFLGLPEKIGKLKVDPYDDSILWCCLSGSGFWKADITALRTGIAKPFFWDWMSEQGLADRTKDTDGDGFDNQMEFYAATDPNNSNSFFVANISPMSADVAIGFPSASSRLYTVEKTEDLNAGWTVLTNGMSGTGNPMDFVDTSTSSNGYYRIKVELE